MVVARGTRVRFALVFCRRDEQAWWLPATFIVAVVVAAVVKNGESWLPGAMRWAAASCACVCDTERCCCVHSEFLDLCSAPLLRQAAAQGTALRVGVVVVVAHLLNIHEGLYACVRE
jgi:hypothetical protein